MVWAALTYITRLPRVDLPVVCRVVRVSGTIRKAEEEVIRRSQKVVKRARAWQEAGNGVDLMLGSVEKSVERERKREVLAGVDGEGEGEEMSE
jgi:ribonuclease P/MRP protein subunit POP5